MAIDAQTAIGKLASIQTEAELRALIADVSVEAKGKLTLLWSGTFGKDANGNDIKMRDAVQQAADANKDLRIIGNTQAAAFLDSPDFEQAVRRIIGPQGTSDFINNPRTGAWATVSDAFVRGTSGEIVTWTANASFERVFGLVELRAALAPESKITSINGFRIDELRRFWLDANSRFGGNTEAAWKQTFELMRLASFESSGVTKITLNGETKSVPEFMRNGMSDAQLKQYYFDGAAAAERMDALNRSVGLRLNRAGALVAGWMLFIAATNAKAATDSGDYDSAARIMGEWGSKFLAGLAGGVAVATVTGEALAPLAMSGPPGATAAFVASLVAGVVGGVFGEHVITQMLAGNANEPALWDTDKVIGLATQNNADGLAWRRALAELNPFVVTNPSEVSDPTGKLDLFDP